MGNMEDRIRNALKQRVITDVQFKKNAFILHLNTLGREERVLLKIRKMDESVSVRLFKEKRYAHREGTFEEASGTFLRLVGDSSMGKNIGRGQK